MNHPIDMDFAFETFCDSVDGLHRLVDAVFALYGYRLKQCIAFVMPRMEHCYGLGRPTDGLRRSLQG
jgi:hypothetical protein